MMKDILQFIGVVVLILVVIFALFFLLDNINMLGGTLGEYVDVMHDCFTTMWGATKGFVTGSGIANEAADLLGEGADKLRNAADSLAQSSGDAARQPTPLPTNAPISGQDPTVTGQPAEFVFSTPVPAVQ